MNKKKEPVNFLSVVPVRNVKDFVEEEGKIILLIPRFKSDTFRKWFSFGKKSPFINVKLDETGSQIWRLIDGKRTIEEICALLLPFMTEKNKPSDHIEERVTQFLSGLFKNELVVSKT